MIKCNVADFETKDIDDEALVRGAPEPVGIALKFVGEPYRYYAFGHPTNNGIYELPGGYKKEVRRLGPCDLHTALTQTKKMWGTDRPILFQNASFDVDVAQQHFKLPVPAWDKIEDTKYLLFFRDPHAPTLALKPSAERYLGMPPEERDLMRDWLIEKGLVPKDASEKVLGANIWRCPGNIVAKYAIGDLVRTEKLYDLLMPWVAENGMEPAYDRERRLMPEFLRNEYEGMRFDLTRARKDIKAYQAANVKAEHWLCDRLKLPQGFNFNRKDALAQALKKEKVITEWTFSEKTGKPVTSKKVLTVDKWRDKEVFRILGYRNRLQTVLALNLFPWTEMAEANGGMIHTSWNQVRASPAAGDPNGTRSGRPSASRVLNVSKDFYDKGDGYEHPKKVAVPELPLIRTYVLADDGGVWGHVDYNQQEFRILAHYEDAEMLEEYQKNPRIDYHTRMQERIKEMFGKEYERRLIKTINFAINYGTGPAKLAETAHIDLALARELKAAAQRAAPGVVALNRSLMDIGRRGEYIRTWGGRMYYCEPPSYSEKFKREMTWEYKLLNYLIQGSAADCTKEALVRLFDHPKFKKHGRFLVTVYDEINCSAHTKADVKPLMRIIKEVMESIEFDVPMLADAKTGPSWGKLTKYKET